MKEVVKVSLSGISFTFDDDAYRTLKQYLDKLENGYGDSSDGREIIADIEARIAELILSQQDNTKIVNHIRIKRIIEQMGMPDEIGGGTVPEGHDMDRIPRRLYRNRENAKIGGLCSGLGTYTDTDPVWFRLGIFAPLLLCIFLAPVSGKLVSALALFFAMLVMLYILLWFAVPAAKTPRQKLEMRGEKITAQAIHQSFKETKSSMADSASKVTSVLGEIIYTIGRVFLLGIKIGLGFIGFFVAISTMAVLTVFIGILFNSPMFFNETVTTLFPNMQIIHPVAYWSMAALLALLPLGMLTYLIFCTIFKFKSYSRIYGVAFMAWLAIAGIFTFFTIRNARNIANDIEYASSCKIRKVRDGLHTVTRSGSWEIVRGDSVVYRTSDTFDNKLNIHIADERLRLVNRSDGTTISIDLKGKSPLCIGNGHGVDEVVIGDTRIRKAAVNDLSITRDGRTLPQDRTPADTTVRP